MTIWFISRMVPQATLIPSHLWIYTKIIHFVLRDRCELLMGKIHTSDDVFDDDVEILSGSVPDSVPDLISITNSDHVGCLNCYIDLVDLRRYKPLKHHLSQGMAWALTHSILVLILSTTRPFFFIFFTPKNRSLSSDCKH